MVGTIKHAGILLLVAVFLHHEEAYSRQDRINGLPNFQHFSSSDYDAGKDNEMVLQDQNGVIYVANSEGLLVFDNFSWNKLVLPNKTRVRSVAQGEDGTIYVGGQGEFGFLAPDSINHIQYISLSDSIEKSERFIADIWDIWPQGDYVIFLSNKQLMIYHNGEFQTMSSESYFRHGHLVSGNLYIQENQKGIYRWTGSSLEYIDSHPIFEREGIAFLEELENGKWLIGMVYSGLFTGDFDSLTRFNTAINEQLGKVKFTCGYRMNDGKILIGTVNQGLLVLSPEGSLLYALNKNTGLKVLDILDIRQDLSGQIWVASNTGLSLVDINGAVTMLDERLGVPGAGFSSSQSDSGELMLGTSQGIYKQNKVDRTFDLIPKTNGTTWYMSNIDDEVWAGHQSGTMHYAKGKLTHFPSEIGGWDFLKVPNKPVVLEGNYSNIHVFGQGDDGHWKFLQDITNINESCRNLVMESDQVLWMSHPYKGVFRITLNDDFTNSNKMQMYGKAHGFPSDIRLFVFKIRDQIIFTSEDGIHEFDAETEQFVSCEWLEDILGKHTSISKLYEDESGNIWFVDNGRPGYIQSTGLLKPKVITGPFVSLAGKMIPAFEHIQSFGDQVILGLQTGFAVYDFKGEKGDEYLFPVAIRSVEQPGKAAPLIDGRFGSTDSIKTFPYVHNNFKFSYSGIDYRSQEKILYRYKLQGYNEHWSEWSPSNQKEYTNLSAGSYSFIVEGKNAYGITSKSDPWLFIIEPPWYLTRWAIVLFSFLAGFVLFGLNRLYTQFRLKEYRINEAEAAKEMMRLKNENLNSEIQHNTKQLASFAFNLSQKENTIRKFKEALQDALDTPEALRVKAEDIVKSADRQLEIQEEWEVFERHFDQVHNKFMTRLRTKHPDLSPVQNKLCAYLRMNLSSKEIAELMNISLAGVEKNRHRLRKKLGLQLEENLKEFIFQI